MQEELKQPKISKPKQPSIRLIKYRKARLEGKNKEESKRAAGYAPSTLTTTIENSDTYKRISIGDKIQEYITLNDIASKHAEVINQDKDLGARNAAIKMAYERIEPDNQAPEIAERVIVVLK